MNDKDKYRWSDEYGLLFLDKDGRELQALQLVKTNCTNKERTRIGKILVKALNEEEKGK